MVKKKEINNSIVSLAADCFFTIQWINWWGEKANKSKMLKKECRIFIPFDGRRCTQKKKNEKQQNDKSLLFDKNKWKLLKIRSDASLSVQCTLWCDTFRCIMRWHTTDAQPSEEFKSFPRRTKKQIKWNKIRRGKLRKARENRRDAREAVDGSRFFLSLVWVASGVFDLCLGSHSRCCPPWHMLRSSTAY